MEQRKATVVSAVVAHVLAWAAALWLAFGPLYQGESVALVTPNGVESEPTGFTATLIEVNGLRVLPLLMAPVALTGVALLAALVMTAGQVKRKVFLWVSAGLLLGFCAVGIFSIGLFYLPAALALAAAAIKGSRRRVLGTRADG